MGWGIRKGLGQFAVMAGLSIAQLGWAGAASPERGRPLLRSFAPRDFGADSQNWAMVQDPRGLLYSANNFGVLEYDGVRWRLIHTRDNTAPRSLAMDARGTVFVGAHNEFGYLAPDELDRMRYVPLDALLPQADRQFGNIWTVTACSQGVYFVATGYLFFWDGHQVRRWKAPSTFFMGYGIRDRFLVLDKEQGLLEPVGDSLRPIPGGRRFAGKKPRFMVPWDDGGKAAILWGSRDEGLVLFQGESFRTWPTPVDAYLKTNILYSGIRLRDGSLALATIQGGIIILEKDRVRRLTKEDGLLNQSAYCLLEDPRSGLWVGGSKGIDVLGWPPQLSRFEEPEGLSGVVLDIRRHEGTLFVTTNLGLFRLSPEADATGRRRFLPVANIKGQCWDMLSLDRTLLVANYDGVYEVAGLRARKVLGTTGHTTCFLPSPQNPNQLFIGTVSGLYAVRRAAPTAPWKDAVRLVEVHEVIRSLTPGEDGSLWVGCDAPTLFKVRVARDASPASTTVERFDAKDGLPEDPWRFTTTLGGQTVAYGPSGVFRFDPGTRRFQRDPRTAPLNLGSEVPLFRLAEGPDGSLWLGCQAEGTSLRHAVPDPDGSYRWTGGPVTCSDAPVFALQPERDGTLWFGGVAGLFRRESPSPAASVEAPAVLIRNLLNKDGHPLSRPASGDAPLIPYTDNTLRFEYALPQLGPTAHPRYQIQLTGLDGAWSPWTAEPYRDYTNLKSGRYEFRVRASLNEGDTPTEAIYAFQVLRPWFRTWWAYGLYLLGLSALMGAVHRARIQLLKRRNEALEVRVADATQALQQQATELAWMNQELRDLNEQKNHFLGIVSHDLKSPINGIVMAAETLRNTQDPQLVAHTAQSIETEGLAMGTLIDRFLNVTALESGRITVHLKRVDAHGALQEAQERHRGRAAAKNLPLALVAGESPLWAKADPFLLGEVLDNLISNALKFSRPGEPIQLRSERRGPHVHLGVEDHGPGLQPEDHRKLFSRFARLSAKPTGGEASVGLGLSIARQLVEAMGGRLWADEARLRGATFWIELPGESGDGVA